MGMQTVAVINESTVLSDKDVEAWIPGLQAQVTEDFAPFYCDASVVFVKKGMKLPPGAFPCHILDNSDQAGALGYHLVDEGWPEGRVFVKTVVSAGGLASVTASHEILEMLADPWCFTTVIIDMNFGGFMGGNAAAIAYEVADGPEADQFSYKKKGVPVSDFVLPWWFGSVAPKNYQGRYSFAGHTREPFSIDRAGNVHGLLPGGYIGIRQFRRASGWGTVNAAVAPIPTLREAEEFRHLMDKMLPSNAPHLLAADGHLLQGVDEVPPGSRRWKRLEKMAVS